MPRKPRIEYPGATYHVMCRGDCRDAVFRDDHDNQLFIETLGEACGRCGWVVHAYVLMANHYHMLLETPEVNGGMPHVNNCVLLKYRTDPFYTATITLTQK